MKIIEDDIFRNKREALKSTIAFLRVLKNILPPKQAALIAREAAVNYMLSVYEDVFLGTVPGSRKRFDVFRENYKKHALITPYCEILISTEYCLRVKFKRCPYAEILSSMDLFEFAEAFCLSDLAMTEQLMPGVEFSRGSSIVGGHTECIMNWSLIGI